MGRCSLPRERSRKYSITVWSRVRKGVFTIWVPVERAFSVLPRRWVVERTFAWLGRNRRLSRDYECMPDVSESYLYIGMDRLMLKRWIKNYA